MNTVEPLRREAPPQTIRTQQSDSTHWCFMHSHQAMQDPGYRPCMNSLLLREMHEFARRVVKTIAHEVQQDDAYLAHLVLASDADVFNLGGDLDLFAQLIRSRDRARLIHYARECVEGVHILQSHFHPNAHTVALVEGDALGGGFEMALGCHTLVAESGVSMGFPEVLFGLFPGMGAYSFLSRRVSPKLAEEMMLNGVIYTSDELYKLGVVDILARKGEGRQAVEELVRRNGRVARARMAMNRVREVVHPIPLDELLRITEIWVDTALGLTERQLRTMERLVRAQHRRPGAASESAQVG